jgi:pimeloyl-ACP methyl ester carboxylesterase
MIELEGSAILGQHSGDPMIKSLSDPAKERWFKELDAGIYDVITARSSDRLTLTAYLRIGMRDTAAGGRWVVILHGMTDSSAGVACLAEEYHARGWNVLIPDLRAHGASEGTVRTMGVREADDIGLWVSELENRYGAKKVYVHGFSMSGSAVLLYASRKKKVSPAVRGVISDSAYGSYEDVLLMQVKRVVRFSFVAWLLVKGSGIACALCSGITYRKMAPNAYIRKAQVPILFFHGQKDSLVPVAMVRKLFAMAAKMDDEVVVIPDAPHTGAYYYARDLYMRKIETFAERREENDPK